jgi:tetratricopeptide (TPR) repeat protein
VSGLIPIPSAPLADRYLYLPAIGFWLIIADQVGRILRCRDVSRHFVVATFLLLSLLAALTCRRNLEWKDDVTLFSRLIEVYPDRAYGYHNLGCYYMDKLKDYDMAEKYFTKALQIDPRFPRLQTQVGYLMLQRGNFHGALDHYVQAIRLNPNDAEAHLNSGNALEQLRRFDEAIVSYRRFLEIPDTELSGFRPTVEAKIHLLSQQMR